MSVGVFLVSDMGGIHRADGIVFPESGTPPIFLIFRAVLLYHILQSMAKGLQGKNPSR